MTWVNDPALPPPHERRPSHDAWMQTDAGVRFDLRDPHPDLVIPEDVALSLSTRIRFSGMMRWPVNVAQHSLLVMDLLLVAHADAGAALLRQALVHDAPEAYVSDVVTPAKRELPAYQALEARVWTACARRFGVPEILHPAVTAADWLACQLEAHLCLSRDPLDGWAGARPSEDLVRFARARLLLRAEPDVWRRGWLAALQRVGG